MKKYKMLQRRSISLLQRDLDKYSKDNWQVCKFNVTGDGYAVIMKLEDAPKQNLIFIAYDESGDNVELFTLENINFNRYRDFTLLTVKIPGDRCKVDVEQDTVSISGSLTYVRTEIDIESNTINQFVHLANGTWELERTAFGHILISDK